MNQDQILHALMQHLREHSGFETDRNYLGMSAIGQCPRRLYDAFVNGQEPTMDIHRMCYIGYLFERDARQRMTEAGLYRPPRVAELIAPFDERFRGHADGETIDGDLLELKSVSEEGLERVAAKGRGKVEHWLQVQTYMRYGPWQNAVIVYISRDSFRHFIVSALKDTHVGEKMEHKAKTVLAAIDARRPPACECGRCK